MEKKSLTICPSRGRPSRLAEMIKSFDATQSCSDLLIYVSNDDPKLSDYKGLDDRIVFGDRLHLVQVLNQFSSDLRYKYYHEVNDDHIFHTMNWDNIFIDILRQHGDWGCVCGNDLLHNWNESKLPSSCMITSNIINSIGYWIYPKINHVYTDNYITSLLEPINMLYHIDGVVIEHRHFLAGKATIDDNYKWVTSEEQMSKDKAAYEEWYNNVRELNQRKIMEAKENEVRCYCQMLSHNGLA